MKTLYLLVSLFSIPLVNGMVNLSVGLEQSVEEHNVAVDDNYSPDMHEVQLDNHEVQLPSRSRRANIIIALALLAVLLSFTFHAMYKPKHRARFLREKFVKGLEEKLAKFRIFVKEKEKELTQAQKATLEEMQDKVKEFLEADDDIKKDLFANDIRNLLMEFFVNGLDQERVYDQKNLHFLNLHFLNLFEDDFFQGINFLHHLDKKGWTWKGEGHYEGGHWTWRWIWFKKHM